VKHHFEKGTFICIGGNDPSFVYILFICLNMFKSGLAFILPVERQKTHFTGRTQRKDQEGQQNPMAVTFNYTSDARKKFCYFYFIFRSINVIKEYQFASYILNK